MSDTNTELILQGFYDLRKEMREEMHDLRGGFTTFAQDCGERLSTAETSIHSLVGNGQPGRVSLVETGLSALGKKVSWMLGWAACAGTVLGLATGGLAVELIKMWH